MNFSKGDLDVLSRTIYGEARNQPLDGQIAVGWVCRNRTARPDRFGASVADVCLRPMQFSCWNRNDPNFIRIVTVNEPDLAYAKAGAAARMVLADLASDPTQGADHYVTVQAPQGTTVWPPSWAAFMRKTVVIGDHVFYREQA